MHEVDPAGGQGSICERSRRDPLSEPLPHVNIRHAARVESSLFEKQSGESFLEAFSIRYRENPVAKVRRKIFVAAPCHIIGCGLREEIGLWAILANDPWLHMQPDHLAQLRAAV
jgi:hypothetical protein